MVNDKKFYSLIEDLENTIINLNKVGVSEELKNDDSLNYVLQGLDDLKCDISDFLDNHEHLR